MTTPASTTRQSTLTPARTVALFVGAFAVAVLLLGIVPVNLLLRRYMSAVMANVWATSLVRLALRAAVSGIACYGLLRVTGRARGTLTSTTPGGMMPVGAVTSGALAGALDVVVHRLAVWPLIHLARQSVVASELASALLTALAAVAVAGILLVPRTRVVSAPGVGTRDGDASAASDAAS